MLKSMAYIMLLMQNCTYYKLHYFDTAVDADIFLVSFCQEGKPLLCGDLKQASGGSMLQ